MKKLLPFFSLAIVLAACNSTPKNTTATSFTSPEAQAMTIDTAGLAQFQEWKVQNELRETEQYNKPEQKPAKAPAKKTRTRKAQPTPAPVSLPDPVENAGSSTPQGSGTDADNAGVINSESGDEAKATRKEGISKAAKGAVIGGIAGAGAGAVINKKNRMVGAVVGAVIGAGGGYVIGRKMDKNDGRY